MPRKLQIVAAFTLALSALAASAGDAEPRGLRLRDAGWTASLFVSPAESRRLFDGDAAHGERPASVDGRLSRRLWRNARVEIDIVNVFDRRAATAPRDFAQPAAPEGRGLRLGLRLGF